MEIVPENLDDGVVYISLKYGIASHRCACGCGEEVVLKIAPQWWRLTYDGETVSFSPSVGNWGLKCKSHYWIIQSKIRWAETWSEERIAAARRSRVVKPEARATEPADGPASSAAPAKITTSWARRLMQRMRGRGHK